MESFDKHRQHIKNQRHHLRTKVHIDKVMVFSVVMYWCESWTIRKAESQRIDALELWCWTRLLRVLWTARRSKQSIVKNSEYSLEGLILKLNLQFFGHLMQRACLLEKILMLGKTEAGREVGCQRMRWLDGIINSVDMSLRKFRRINSEEQGCLECCNMRWQRVGHDWVTEKQLCSNILLCSYVIKLCNEIS